MFMPEHRSYKVFITSIGIINAEVGWDQYTVSFQVDYLLESTRKVLLFWFRPCRYFYLLLCKWCHLIVFNFHKCRHLVDKIVTNESGGTWCQDIGCIPWVVCGACFHSAAEINSRYGFNILGPLAILFRFGYSKMEFLSNQNSELSEYFPNFRVPQPKIGGTWTSKCHQSPHECALVKWVKHK